MQTVCLAFHLLFNAMTEAQHSVSRFLLGMTEGLALHRWTAERCPYTGEGDQCQRKARLAALGGADECVRPYIRGSLVGGAVCRKWDPQQTALSGAVALMPLFHSRLAAWAVFFCRFTACILCSTPHHSTQ